MTRAALMTLAGCLFLVPPTAADEKDRDAKADLARLRGKWRMAAVASPLDVLRGLAKGGSEVAITTSLDDDTLAFDGDKLVCSNPLKGGWGGDWVVALDTSASPKVFRLARPPVKTGQPGWKVDRFESIYDVTGDMLRLGINLGLGPDKGLPDSFEVRTGRVMAAVLVFKRVPGDGLALQGIPITLPRTTR